MKTLSSARSINDLSTWAEREPEPCWYQALSKRPQCLRFLFEAGRPEQHLQSGQLTFLLKSRRRRFSIVLNNSVQFASKHIMSICLFIQSERYFLNRAGVFVLNKFED